MTLLEIARQLWYDIGIKTADRTIHPHMVDDAAQAICDAIEEVINDVNLEWEIYFPSTAAVIEIDCNINMSITHVDKGVKANQISYSIDDGTTWTVANMTLVSGNLYSFNSSIACDAGTAIKFRIDSFNNSKTDATIIIKGLKVS